MEGNIEGEETEANAGEAGGATRRADENEVALGLDDAEPRGPKTTAIGSDDDDDDAR